MKKAPSWQRKSEFSQSRIPRLKVNQVGLNTKQLTTRVKDTVHEKKLPLSIPIRTNNILLTTFTKPAQYLPNISTIVENAMCASDHALPLSTTREPESLKPLVPIDRETSTATLECNNNNHSANNFSLEDICLACRDFSAVDKHAANYSRRDVSSIPNLARDLCTPFALNVDKARAIFTWLHHNIAYDTVAYFENNVRRKSADETLRTGLSVCQGYAELFEQLACHSGLKVLVVSGHGKGHKDVLVTSSFKSNHAWNAVELDSGKWHLVDACWGAGGVDKNQNFKKHFNPYYFTASPETFRAKHFPANLEHQFCTKEMSWEEYITMKDGPLIYKDFEDKGFNEAAIYPCVGMIRPQPTKIIISSKCQHITIKPADQYRLVLFVDGIRKHFDVDSNGTTWTCETGTIKQGSNISVDCLENLGGRNGKEITVRDYLLAIGRASQTWGRMCSWEVH